MTDKRLSAIGGEVISTNTSVKKSLSAIGGEVISTRTSVTKSLSAIGTEVVSTRTIVEKRLSALGLESITSVSQINEPLSSPDSVTASNVTASTATVFWFSPSTGESPTSYEYSLNDEVPIDVGLETQIELTGLTAETYYLVRVRSVLDGEYSEWVTAPFTTTAGAPNSPTNLVASNITGTSSKVTWSASPTGPETISYEAIIDFGEVTPYDLTPAEIDLVDLTPGTDHSVRVRSVGEHGFSDWVVVTFATTGAPVPPGALTSSNVTTTSARISWSAPIPPPAPTKYEYSINLAAPVNNGLVTYVDLVGLDPQSSYSVRVRSVGEYGTSTWASVSFITLLGPPEEPTDLSVIEATSTTASLSWSAPLSGSTPSSYEYSIDGSSAADAGLSTQIGFEGLIPGSTHNFRVRATNSEGVSDWVEVNFELNPGAPSPPLNLQVSSVSKTGATVQWYTPLGVEVLSYEYSLDMSAVQNSALVRMLVLENISEGSSHNLRVRSVGEFGTSAWSEISFTTDASEIETGSKRLVWDLPGTREFEHGLDLGVLYLTDPSVESVSANPKYNVGVAWSGLVSVDESLSDEGTEPLYMDGVKYLDALIMGDYSASLRAIIYPNEFQQFEGYGRIGIGVDADDQTVTTFGLSYRTLIDNDIETDGSDYKIHLVYNLTAYPEAKSNVTQSNELSANEFGWNISAVPLRIPGYRPTAHIILDSRYLHKLILREIEDMIYGSDKFQAHLPTIEELSSFIENFEFLKIVDNGDGTWTATGPDELITMIDSTTFRIDEVDATYLDEDTYVMETTN